LALYNEYLRRRGDEAKQREVINEYNEIISREKGAENCIKCRECEKKCPQHLPISELLTKVARIFGRSG